MRQSAARVAAQAADGFRDEEGFTTIGVVLTLLIALSLLFSAAQVQRINSVAAEVQDVADAAALAAQNEVAEFMIVVRVCDAVALTMTLTGLVTTGLGVAALCTPYTAGASPGLLRAGKQILDARDAFSDKASKGLTALQSALPFLSAANAAAIAQANNGPDGGSSYLALALPFPADAEPIDAGSSGGAQDMADAADGQADEIRQAAERAEELAQESAAVKERAFRHDCGNAPGYCMYERADTLAGLGALDNPLYRSVDTWSFSVALRRAQAYYAQRIAIERPEGSSIEEQARSALREKFYRYAARELSFGYVYDDGSTFDAHFPRLPRNTDDMRATTLYTNPAYPVSTDDEERGPVMHAWSGCPEATGELSWGSIARMEAEGMATCPACGFTAASLGKVAAASSSIDNGFEYHYAVVADAAEEYERARAELAPETQAVKDKAGGLLDWCADLIGEAADFRIDAAPPGNLGTIVFVVNLAEVPSSSGFANSFVDDAGVLGARAAISAATLVPDEADGQGNVISSLLDGLDDGIAAGFAGIVLDVWGGLLSVYSTGQEALSGAVSGALDFLPFAGASGLGTWVTGFFEDAIASVGLQPVKMDALKPALVNSAHVAQKDGSEFSARLVSVKRQVIAYPSASSDIFSSVVGAAETALTDRIAALSGGIEVADVELFSGGPAFTIRIALPAALTEGAERFVEDAADALRDLGATVTGVRVWE